MKTSSAMRQWIVTWGRKATAMVGTQRKLCAVRVQQSGMFENSSDTPPSRTESTLCTGVTLHIRWGRDTASSPRPLHTHRHTHRHRHTDTDLSCEGLRATRDGPCLSFEWGANSNGNVMRHTAPSEQRHRRVTVRHRYLHGRLACAKCLQEREDVLGVDWAVPARARVSVRRKCAACKVETHHAKR